MKIVYHCILILSCLLMACTSQPDQIELSEMTNGEVQVSSQDSLAPQNLTSDTGHSFFTVNWEPPGDATSYSYSVNINGKMAREKFECGSLSECTRFSFSAFDFNKTYKKEGSDEVVIEILTHTEDGKTHSSTLKTKLRTKTESIQNSCFEETVLIFSTASERPFRIQCSPTEPPADPPTVDSPEPSNSASPATGE